MTESTMKTQTTYEPVVEDVGVVAIVEGPDAGLDRVLDQDRITVGSGEAAGLRLSDRSVSRLHLELAREGGHVRARDLGSKNGTFVNSDRRIQRVRRAIPPLEGTVPDGDIYQLVAERMGADLGFGSPPDPAKVMDEVATLSPNWRGVSYARLEDPASFLQWPCVSPDDPGSLGGHAQQQLNGSVGLAACPQFQHLTK